MYAQIHINQLWQANSVTNMRKLENLSLFIYHLSVAWVAMFNTATDTTDYMPSQCITIKHDDGEDNRNKNI